MAAILHSSHGLCLQKVAASRAPPFTSPSRIGVNEGSMASLQPMSRRGAPAMPFQARFDFPEMYRLARLLGDEVIQALIANRAATACATLAEARLDHVASDVIHISFTAAGTKAAQQQVATTVIALREKFSVSGVEFVCKVDGLVTSIHGADAMNETGASDGAAADRLTLLRDLATAIPENELCLEYQPKVDVRMDQIHSAEALLRWRRADGTLANTGELIALAEATGAIGAITRWTLTRALADLEVLKAAGWATAVYVNVSADLLTNPACCNAIVAAGHAAGGLLGIEVTETAVIHDPAAAIANLHTIAAAGVPIAIDDFGSGLSSLEYLQQLPACEVKIDRNFISGLSKSNRNPLIVRATIDLAHAMEMKVTAEGVEDAMSFALLRMMGCDMVQGHFVSKSLPLGDLMSFLQSYSGQAASPTLFRVAKKRTAP